MAKSINPKNNGMNGQKEQNDVPRPPTPPSQSPPVEEPPSIEMMEGAKNAMMSFLMYYYQSLRMEGNDVPTAKKMMGRYISELYEQFASHARIEYIPDTFRDPEKLLSEIISDVKALGITGKPVHQKLLDFKRLIKE